MSIPALLTPEQFARLAASTKRRPEAIVKALSTDPEWGLDRATAEAVVAAAFAERAFLDEEERRLLAELATRSEHDLDVSIHARQSPGARDVPSDLRDTLLAAARFAEAVAHAGGFTEEMAATAMQAAFLLSCEDAEAIAAWAFEGDFHR